MVIFALEFRGERERERRNCSSFERMFEIKFVPCGEGREICLEAFPRSQGHKFIHILFKWNYTLIDVANMSIDLLRRYFNFVL